MSDASEFPGWIRGIEYAFGGGLKDLADLEQVLRTQGSALDRTRVRAQLREIYGERDPRLPRWDELCRAADAQG